MIKLKTRARRRLQFLIASICIGAFETSSPAQGIAAEGSPLRATSSSVIPLNRNGSDRETLQQPVFVQNAGSAPGNLEAQHAEVIAVPPLPAPSPLTLQELEQIARVNNPSLAEYIARVNAMRGKWEQVGLAPNPYAGYSGQQVGSGNIAEQRGVVFGQELITGHKLQLNREMASREVQRADQEYQAQMLKVMTDVRMSYYDVLATQERVRLAQQIVSTSTGVVAVIDKRIQAKEGTRSDLLQAQIELEGIQIQQQRSANQNIEAWRKLTAVAGVPYMEPQQLTGNLEEGIPVYEWEPTLARLLSGSPEVAAARAEIQKTRWGYQRALAERHSNISFQGIVQDDRSIDAVNGAVQVTLPIQIWNRNQGGITQAGHESIVAERALQKLELSLQQRLAVVFQRYSTARVQVDRYRNVILPRALENFKLVETAYRAGEYDYLQMLIAQRTYSQSTMAYIDSIQELRALSLEIDGFLQTDSLQSK